MVTSLPEPFFRDTIGLGVLQGLTLSNLFMELLLKAFTEGEK